MRAFVGACADVCVRFALMCALDSRHQEKSSTGRGKRGTEYLASGLIHANQLGFVRSDEAELAAEVEEARVGLSYDSLPDDSFQERLGRNNPIKGWRS